MALDDLLSLGTSSGKWGEASLVTTVDSYIRYYASGSSHTARAKRLDLRHFLRFLAEYRGYSKQTKLKVSDWDFSSVQRFVDDCLARNEAPATVARRLATIKHMGRTLAEKVAGFVNPAREVKSPQLQTPLPKALSEQEVAEVQSRARQRTMHKGSFVRFRNLVIFDFLIDTGLRAEEIRLLKRGQIDDDLEWIKSVRTKGRRYRNVYITSKMRPLLAKYLEVREKELSRFYAKLSRAQDRVLPLFISNYAAEPGRPDTFLMGTKTLWRAVHELSTNTKLHPHLLRHSYALDLLSSSNDIRLVSQALGHSDVRVTMRYTQRLDDEVASALEKARAKRKA